MKRHLTSQQQRQQQEQQSSSLNSEQSSALEFGTVEEMIRHDAVHTPVPPRIEHRLAESARGIPPPRARSWWKRLFGG